MEQFGGDDQYALGVDFGHDGFLLIILRAQVPGLNGKNVNLQNQHGVAVAVKAVLFADGGLVGVLHECVAAEGADQYQQGRAGEMKIRQQGIDGAELVRRADK